MITLTVHIAIVFILSGSFSLMILGLLGWDRSGQIIDFGFGATTPHQPASAHRVSQWMPKRFFASFITWYACKIMTLHYTNSKN